MGSNIKRDSHEWISAALEKHEQQLLRYTYRITKNLDSAREIVQEAFLKLCRADPESVEGHVQEWLYTVCRNAAFDQHRKVRPTLSLDDHLASPIETPSKRVELNLQVNRILSLMEELTEDQQEVLGLKFQDGLSYAEISKITGHSVSNVGYLIHIAVRKIRDRIEELRESSYGRRDG